MSVSAVLSPSSPTRRQTTVWSGSAVNILEPWAPLGGVSQRLGDQVKRTRFAEEPSAPQVVCQRTVRAIAADPAGEHHNRYRRTLTNERGKAFPVTGPSDIEQHDANLSAVRQSARLVNSAD